MALEGLDPPLSLNPLGHSSYGQGVCIGEKHKHCVFILRGLHCPQPGPWGEDPEQADGGEGGLCVQGCPGRHLLSVWRLMADVWVNLL